MIRTRLGAALALWSLGTAAGAQTVGAQVVVAPGKPGRLMISVALREALPRPALKERYQRLVTALGARCGALQMDTRRGVSTLSFATAAALVDGVAGRVTVAPFVRTLGDLGPVGVNFFVPTTFAYRGPKQGEENGWRWRVSADPGWVSVLAEPVPSAPAPRRATAAPRNRSSNVVALLGMAALVGVGVYLVALRLTKR